MLAYRFESFIQDTLRAVRICFNDSYLDANKRAFDLMVWDDNEGVPGNIIYSVEEVMVEQGEEVNGFYTYLLPEGVMVNDIFYVGWKQRSETFLNAGFDVNTLHKGRQFYWINGEWRLSQAKGSIMIRPVVGDRIKVTTVHDTYYRNKNLITLWPNPANEYFSLDAGELQLSGFSCISVFDMNGRELIKEPYAERIDITSLKEGVYIVITTLNGKPVGYNRLIKTK
jgi:hypothetical protein